MVTLLFGCGTSTTLESPHNNDVEFTKLTTKKDVDQQASNQAKDFIRRYEEVTSIKAVNTSKHLVVGFEVEHMERFNLEDIRKKIQKKLKKEFSSLKVVVSTDQKIILELDKLEQNIQSGKVSKKQLNKKAKKIIDLSKEQT